ncbi:MAG: MBL fold metallo-hydrolase [Brevinematales bacterium]|jgi:glyoxylase-like metal-dependent hydrolase (beta-lactamase superfamily II)
MTVKRYYTESYYTNTYLILSGSDAILIDPVDDSDELKEAARGLNITYIVNTHGHFDHITGNAYFKALTGAKIAIGKDDAVMLPSPELNLSTVFSIPVISPEPDLEFVENDVLKAGDDTFSILFFPGHTSGGIALYSREKNMLFSGDFIFRDSIGRMDSPTGSIEKMKESLKKVILMPPETVVYPGHGLPFSLGDFIKEIYPEIIKEL